MGKSCLFFAFFRIYGKSRVGSSLKIKNQQFEEPFWLKTFLKSKKFSN